METNYGLRSGGASNRADFFGQIRVLALAGAIGSLTIVTFDSSALSSIAWYTRYGFVLLLVTTTFFMRIGVGPIRLKDSNRPVRMLIASGWLMVFIALWLAPLSLVPSLALAQILLFALLIATLHVHVTCRWHGSGTVTADMRTIFWTLTAAVGTSLAVGLGEMRLSGLFANPNTLALVAAMAAMLGVGLLVEKRSMVLIVAVVIDLTALVLTQTRTGVLAVIVAIVFIMVRTYRSKAGRTMVTTTLGLFIGVVIYRFVGGNISLPPVFYRFAYESEGDSLNSREDGWAKAIELWLERPLNGYGFRLGEVAFRENSGVGSFSHDVVHSSYLQVLLEVGVLGFVPFLGMLLSLLLALVQNPLSGIRVGLLGVILIGLVSGFTESALFGVGQSVSWVFWMCGGAAAVLVPYKVSSSRSNFFGKAGIK